MCVPVHFSNLKNAEFNINALYTYTCIIKCEINLLHITLHACKMFETFLRRGCLLSEEVYVLFSHTCGTFAKECKDTHIAAITQRAHRNNVLAVLVQ